MMTKEDLNRRLEQMLSPVRFRQSKVSPTMDDGRTPFDSDFARIALSAPVRRLQDKTQVFPLAEHDFTRNRLTHSMEVMCFAKGIGLGVERRLRELGLFEIERLNPLYRNAISKILETAALVHDVGNPPYGHSGEKAVQQYFKSQPNKYVQEYFSRLSAQQQADLCNIEGNVQGLRILRHLGLSNDSYSFNLTMPVLATIVKYPFNSIEGNKKKIDHEHKKFGYLQAEEADYLQICETLGLRADGQRHPLTYLLEAADDIAYSVCDIEDGIKNNIINLDMLVDRLQSLTNDAQLLAIISNIRTETNKVRQEVNVMQLRVRVQSIMINDCIESFINNYEDIMLGRFHGELIAKSPSFGMQELFNQFDITNFESPMVREKEQKGVAAISYLLDGFLTAVLMYNDKENTEENVAKQIVTYLSPNYRQLLIDDEGKMDDDTYRRMLLVTDYIFGMTDSYCLRLYNEDNLRLLFQQAYQEIIK